MENKEKKIKARNGFQILPCNDCKQPMEVAKTSKGVEVVGGTCWRCVTRRSLDMEENK